MPICLDQILLVETTEDGFTYDLEVEHLDHTFFVNDISVSNSHAISYAITTWQCAWFLTYYPEQWITTYLDYCTEDKGKVTGQEDPKATAIKEAKQLGYTVIKPDINLSGFGFECHPTLPNTIVPGFGSMKYVGKTVTSEIEANRPYKSVQDLLISNHGNGWSWRHSKFNKRALSTLIKLEALDSMNLVGPMRSFKTYKQLHYVVVDHYDELKRICSRKKDNDVNNVTAAIESMLNELADNSDWSIEEKIQFCSELAGSVELDMLVSPETRKTLREAGLTSIDCWEEEAEQGNHWAVVSSIQSATTKTGKPYAKIKLFAESAKEQMCFVWNCKPQQLNIKKHDVVVGHFKKSEFGLSAFPGGLKTVL